MPGLKVSRGEVSRSPKRKTVLPILTTWRPSLPRHSVADS
jgi:hypothetical protein